MRWLRALVVLWPCLSVAQSFQGFDSRKKVAPAPVVVPANPDYAYGDPVVALPPRNAKNQLDLESYKILHAALKERLGPRLRTEAETLREAQKQEPIALSTADGQTVIGDALHTQLFITFTLSPKTATASLLPKPGAPSVADVLVDLVGGKINPAQARRLVFDLVKKGEAVLKPPMELDVTPEASKPQPPPVATSPAPAETYEDIENEAVARRHTKAEEALGPAGLNVFVGMGPDFRALMATGTTPVAPRSPDAMAAASAELIVFPLRFVPKLKDSKLAELGVEGYYRYNLVRGESAYNGVSSTCAAIDDELRGQLFYRYPLGGRLPRIGLGVGLAQERTRFASACTAPALNTTYASTELQLKVQQPILGEVLTVDLSGGPRILFSTRASGFNTRAWSLEGWFTARPLRYVAVRLGARFTQTLLTTWPEGVSLLDNRTFVGLELGATL